MKSVGKTRLALPLFALCLLASLGNVKANGRASIDASKTNVAGRPPGPMRAAGQSGIFKFRRRIK